MYVLKCVKPGYFNCDRSAGTGHFVGEGGDSTRNLNRAAMFHTKIGAREYRAAIAHVDTDYEPKKDAVFEIAPILITLK